MRLGQSFAREAREVMPVVGASKQERGLKLRIMEAVAEVGVGICENFCILAVVEKVRNSKCWRKSVAQTSCTGK